MEGGLNSSEPVHGPVGKGGPDRGGRLLADVVEGEAPAPFEEDEAVLGFGCVDFGERAAFGAQEATDRFFYFQEVVGSVPCQRRKGLLFDRQAGAGWRGDLPDGVAPSFSAGEGTDADPVRSVRQEAG